MSQNLFMPSLPSRRTDWELPHLPDGGVPQQPQDNLLFNDIPANNLPDDGLLDIARWPDWDPLDKDGSHQDESDEDQSDEDLSEEDLSQDGDDGLLQDDNFQGFQHGSDGIPQQPIPAVMHNPNLKICDEPSCIKPTFHQTVRKGKKVKVKDRSKLKQLSGTTIFRSSSNIKMEFTRSDGDGASHSRKRRRLDELVGEGGHRPELPPYRPPSNYCPLQPNAFYNGPPSPVGNNTFLDQPLRQPQKASTEGQDVLRPRGSSHFQTGMYSPSHHDHSYRPQRPAAFSNGSTKGSNSPLDCPVRQPQKPSTLYQDIVRPGNDPQCRILSLSLHDHSYPPKNPAAFSNGSLQRDSSALDWPLRHPHQSSASDNLTDIWNMSVTPEDFLPKKDPLSPSQPLSANYQFGQSDWEESVGVEVEDAMIRNDLGFADKPVLPDRLLFQGVNLQEDHIHVQEQLVSVARQPTNPLPNDIPIPDQLKHLMGPSGYSWQFPSPLSMPQPTQPQQIQPQQIQPQQIQPQQIQPQQIQPSQAAAVVEPPQPATNPTASQGQPIKRCKEPGCNRPRLFQTSRSRKCKEHLENSLPESRLSALDQDATAGHDMCSGCNGLRPRRAPGQTCWDCFCKGRRRRLGFCNGCPAFRCPNRVIEEA